MMAQSVVEGLIEHANTVLARASASGTKPSCQALANITWAMATLNIIDEPLLKAQIRWDELRAAMETGRAEAMAVPGEGLGWFGDVGTRGQPDERCSDARVKVNSLIDILD
eukprot:Skav211644  [mRNA]  locus=scaffold1290:190816:195278:- [translate_table: standard]